MASSSANRDGYRQYAHFLRNSVDKVNVEVTPGRLDYLRTQVNGERNKFLIWEILWLLVAIIAAVPIVMLVAVEFDLPLPVEIAERAATFHFQVVMLDNTAAWLATVASAVLFVGTTGAAYAPIILHADALVDLEHAKRRLDSVRRVQSA
jgi:hypothetical protein